MQVLAEQLERVTGKGSLAETPVAASAPPALLEVIPASSLVEGSSGIEPPMGSYDLVVGPFTRFTALVGFTNRLRTLPGIESVATRYFAKSMAHLRVRYDDPIELSTRIAEMTEFTPRVKRVSAGRFDVQIAVPPAS